MNNDVTKSDPVNIVLDTRVFRRLVQDGTSAQRVAPVLEILDTHLPFFLCCSYALWGEYVGLRRPQFKYSDVTSPFKNLTSLDALVPTIHQCFDELLLWYQSNHDLSSDALERRALRFLNCHVTNKIRQARAFAERLILMPGMKWTSEDERWRRISDQLARGYAFDELFYFLRDIPPLALDIIGDVVNAVSKTLVYNPHLPIYRLVDSIIELIFRLPEETAAKYSRRERRRIISKSRQGMKELRSDEYGDSVALWMAVQGHLTKDGLHPVLLLTCDTQFHARAERLVDIASAIHGGSSILSALQEKDFLMPGRILCFKDDLSRDSPELNVGTLVQKATNYAARIYQSAV